MATVIFAAEVIVSFAVTCWHFPASLSVARARGISCCLSNSVLAAESRGFLRNPRQVPALNALSRPQVVPGGGSSDVYISFTPLVLPDTEAELCCDGVVLGFMSLDSKVNRLSQQG